MSQPDNDMSLIPLPAGCWRLPEGAQTEVDRLFRQHSVSPYVRKRFWDFIPVYKPNRNELLALARRLVAGPAAGNGETSHA